MFVSCIIYLKFFVVENVAHSFFSFFLFYFFSSRTTTLLSDDSIAEVLVLPTRHFDHTIRQVTLSRKLVFNPVASLHAIMLPHEERTKEEFESALHYASKQLSFFRQLPLLATKPILERSRPRKVAANHVILREGSMGTQVYIIVEGECAVQRLGRSATRALG